VRSELARLLTKGVRLKEATRQVAGAAGWRPREVYRLAARDKRWYMWIPAISCLIPAPLLAGVYLAESAHTAIFLLFIPGLLSNVYVANTIASTHGLVGLRMRATSSAILFFILNMIGLGLGPWSVGVVSDYLEPTLGAESLRHAMLYLLPAATVLSGLLFILAARHLREDLARAPD